MNERVSRRYLLGAVAGAAAAVPFLRRPAAAADRPGALGPDLARALEPERLLQGCGINPDPWQRELLRSRESRMLLCCSRQAGKSTVTASLALYTALYEPGSLVLLLAPAYRQSRELFAKCLQVYRAIGRPMAAQAENTLELRLVNDSRIVCLPGKEESIRGFSSVRLLICDEAARIPDALYFSVRPMLAISGGRFVGMSTPWGKRGWFFESWEKGGAAWQRFRVPATDCPRISAAFLEEERQALGPWWFAQEYLCEFRDATDQLFSSEVVRGALADDIDPLFGGAA